MLVVLASLALLVAEKLKREKTRQQQAEAAEVAKQEAIERLGRIVDDLRKPFHPKQRRFRDSKHLRKIGCTTRRAGKTTLIARETTALALEEPNFRGVYCHATQAEAKRLIWRGDTGDGWMDLIERYGIRVARTRKEFEKNLAYDALVNESDLTIDFRNGSQLMVFCADTEADNDKLRGGQKNIVVVDEAQKYPSLTYFVRQVVVPLLAHPERPGQLWLMGTPSQSLAGLFYEASKPPEQGERPTDKDGNPTWELHQWTVLDNPAYGLTPEERWEATAGATLASEGWDPKDPPPEFTREWLGQWATGDALFVYLVHKYPPAFLLPGRLHEATGAYDHAAAVRDLPPRFINADGNEETIVWYFALGVDFGGNPDPFAWSLAAFSPQIADIYEMGSWKRTDLNTDEMRDHLMSLWETVGHALVVFRGDSSGATGKPLMQAWQESVRLPIEPADRHAKEAVRTMFNGELAARRFHFREGSPLLDEMRHLQWREVKAPGGEVKRVVWKNRVIRDPKTGEERAPGDHCVDASLYLYRDLIARRLEFDTGSATEEERLKREEQRLLDSIRRDRSDDDEYEREWT